MILEPLPYTETHLDLFFKYKKNNEFLGIAEFNKHKLDFGTFSYLPNLVDNFFREGMFINDIETLFYEDNDKFRNCFEGYTKLCWLAYEYIQNEYKFSNPIGVHYNPTNKIWNIHPGGSRQVILNYFGNDIIETIAFNTGGIKQEFKIIFNDKDSLEDYFINKDFFVVCVADKGSIIPHVHFDQNELSIQTLKWAKKVQEFWKNTNVIGSVHELMTQHNSKNKRKTLRINLEDNNDLIKGLILLPSYDKFYKHGVEIRDVSAEFTKSCDRSFWRL
jgi:hypothetical protein